jgi:peptidase E
VGVTTRRILATSGGWIPGPAQGTVRMGAMVLEALGATGKVRPTVCLLETASGDPYSSYALSFEAFNAAGCSVTQLRVFPQPSAVPAERLTTVDLVWVGGGSLANLLALWRLHGIDLAMREAWEAGVILAGVSAGSTCWHVGGPADSFGPNLTPITNGLALVPYGAGVHYDSEAARRPLLQRLVAEGTLPTSYATDDHVGLWYEGTEATRVVADFDVDPATGPAAYRVELSAGVVREVRVGVGGRFT